VVGLRCAGCLQGDAAAAHSRCVCCILNHLMWFLQCDAIESSYQHLTSKHSSPNESPALSTATSFSRLLPGAARTATAACSKHISSGAHASCWLGTGVGRCVHQHAWLLQEPLQKHTLPVCRQLVLFCTLQLVCHTPC
jgi:hypothetical protein